MKLFGKVQTRAGVPLPDAVVTVSPGASKEQTVVTHEGVADSIAGWSRKTGIPYLKLRRRIVDGWAVARALEAKDCAVRARIWKDAP